MPIKIPKKMLEKF